MYPKLFTMWLGSTLQSPVNAHFQAASGLQLCWQAQYFEAYFLREAPKVLVYAAFRALEL